MELKESVVVCGLWAVCCGLWAVGCGLCAVGCVQWAVGCVQWAVCFVLCAVGCVQWALCRVLWVVGCVLYAMGSGLWAAWTTLKLSRKSRQWPRGLRRRSAVACWDSGFESNRGQGCLSVCLSVVSVVCCQVEVSATCWSLVHGSTADCGASLWVI